MRKKKVVVLHAQVPFVRGGAEILVENLVKNLKRRKFDAELISIPFKWYPHATLLDSYFMWRMVDLTESNGEKIDLVIPLKVPTYAVRHHNKVTWVMHQYRAAYDLKDNVEFRGLNTIPGGREVLHKIEKMDNMFLPESKVIYTISKNVAARLKKYNNITASPLYHPPVLAGRYFCGEQEDYILSVGRLDESKRVDLLIRALPYCDKKLRVMIAGKGNMQPILEKLAKDLDVSDRVSFLGFVPDDDLLRLYANALAVCYPPIDEDYGYITLETFLSKKPVISCHDSGGVLEFLEHNHNGIVCDANPEEIGEAFNRFFHNKKLAQDYGMDGYEKVKDIKWDHVIDELTKTI